MIVPQYIVVCFMTCLHISKSRIIWSSYDSFELVSEFKQTRQSSTGANGPPARGVDGRTNGNYENGHTCTHTKSENNPWWYVDLGTETVISKIVIYNRDNCCEERLADIEVRVGNSKVSPFSNNSQCDSRISHRDAISRNPVELTCNPPISGKYVTVSKAMGIITLCEVKVYKDVQNPNVLCPKDIEISSDVNQNLNPVRWQHPTVIENTGVTVATCSKPCGSLFEVGFTKITCSATDPSGNEGNCSFVVHVKDDKEPTITCPEHITVNHDVDQSENPVTWNEPTVIDNVHKDISATCTHASGSIFDVGSTIVTCSATDGTGNVGICSFVVHVIGHTFIPDVPTVMCPHSISTCSDESLQPVTWNDPKVMDDFDSDLVATCIPSSGDLFSRGSTQVTCSVTNSFGNNGNCSFFVDVTSPKAPQVFKASSQDKDVSDVTRGYLTAAVAVLGIMVLILVLANIIIARYYKRKCDRIAGGLIMKMEDNNASWN
ncbi:uncharacterized protein [Antedon mediterranea]|uniref:uncharacterized protein isoform X1 n=1 Tax=Antedon mediterranea TaxID=105859 RepID=UPI003AF66D84